MLTIHKAKGLEFDSVFLPELDTDNLASSGVPEPPCSTSGTATRAAMAAARSTSSFGAAL